MAIAIPRKKPTANTFRTSGTKTSSMEGAEGGKDSGRGVRG